MKTIKSVLLISVLFSTVFCQNKEIEQKLNLLLTQNDYFRLRTELYSTKNTLDSTTYFYYNAFIENSLLHTKNSNEIIKKLFDNSFLEFTDTMKAKLLQLREDNYVKMFKYKSAAQTAKIILDSYTHVLDSSTIYDEKESYSMWNALSNVPPQNMKIEKTSKVPLQKNVLGLQNIPVEVNGIECGFLLDTGANLCVIRKGYAEKLKLKIIDISIDVKGSTDTKTKSQIGIADKIRIGNCIVTNVLFLIIPDEALTIPQVNYTIDGIIGFPVLAQMKEIRFSNEGFLTIPKLGTQSDLQNLVIWGSNPVVSFSTGSDTLHFLFDTGANKSELSKAYYDKYEEYILKNGKVDSAQYGALGEFNNISTKKYYVLEDFIFYAGSKKALLPSIDIFPFILRNDRKMFYGSIGQDLINLFDEMIINFEYMYVDFN